MNKRLLVNAMVALAAAVFISSVASLVEASEKQTVLLRCEQLFGPPVDKKQNLFEANPFYVLRVKFDNRATLKELAVEPKFFYEETHPEWTEPPSFAYLSLTNYETLLTRLEQIKPKGGVVNSGSSDGIVTNMTSRHKALFENAVVEWGEVVDLRRGESAPPLVRWFRVKYSKPA